jgi:hypothetical protein
MHSKRIQLAFSVFASFFLVSVPLASGLQPPSPPPTPTVPPIIGPISFGHPPPTLQPPILGPSATVVLPTAAYAIARSVNGLFQRVGLSPDQVAQITVQYPAAQSLQFVKAEAVDGGLVAANIPAVQPPNNPIGGFVQFTHFGGGVINANGTFTLAFKAGHTPGLYQVRLKQTDRVLTLRFWVLDSQNPQNNPPVIAPTMTGGVQ